MTTDLDDAVRSALADIVAAAPDPGDEPILLATIHRRTSSRRPFLAVAASLTLLAGIGGLYLADSRDPSPDGAVPTTAGSPSTTIDPFAGLDLSASDVPADLELRFTSSLDEFGQIWVYDSSSTGQIYFIRRGASGSTFGQLDRPTYESGHGWGLDGQPGTNLLWGLAPPSLHVTAAFGSTSVSADENGLWYVGARKDLPGFTITTPTETFTVDLVTSTETPQTTVETVPG